MIVWWVKVTSGHNCSKDIALASSSHWWDMFQATQPLLFASLVILKMTQFKLKKRNENRRMLLVSALKFKVTYMGSFPLSYRVSTLHRLLQSPKNKGQNFPCLPCSNENIWKWCVAVKSTIELIMGWHYSYNDNHNHHSVTVSVYRCVDLPLRTVGICLGLPGHILCHR